MGGTELFIRLIHEIRGLSFFLGDLRAFAVFSALETTVMCNIANGHFAAGKTERS